ncbi:MAG: mammalian cell entry protein [Mycobacterium sp.]|nr:mammalian cell entry protein [Mycobacterium sp.]
MAEHADTEQLENPVAADLPETPAGSGLKTVLAQRIARVPLLVVVGLVLVAAVGGLVGWLGFRSHQAQQDQAQDNLYVQTARQAAVNLTTINYTEADADIKRILDSATGAFRDDFQQRSQPFVEVVKQARSKSEGTVTEAGLESASGDQAQVLLAVSVKTSLSAAPAGQPRNWRMRISVEKVGDGAKISNVQFVP